MTIILDRTAAHLVNAGKKEFICDTEADVAALPADCAPGSTAKVVESGALYMINSAGTWVKQPAGATSSSGESGGGSGGDDTVSGDDVATDQEAADIIDSIFGS